MEENRSFDLNKMEVTGPEISSEVQEPQLKFRARTFFIPLLFGLIYVLIQAFSAVAYIFAVHSKQLLGLEGEDVKVQLKLLLLDGNINVYSTFIMAALIIPIFYFFIKKRSVRYPGSLLQGPIERRSLLSSIAATTIGILGVNLLITVLTLMGTQVPYIQTKFDEYERLINLIIPGNVSPLLNLLSVVILVPICEELLFRGVMMGEFMLAMKKPYAAILTGLVFALFHGNFIQSSYVLIPGLILSFAYYLTGSLKVPIILHCWFNFFGGFLPSILEADKVDGSGAVTYGTIMIVSYVISIVYLIYAAYKRSRSRQVA
ncbi:MAG: type II CAAX endopeptidase family protein [Eubacteriales bacterium]|nr:type II CAAX endopeptidase family protein [Eubacteriales bacterium]